MQVDRCDFCYIEPLKPSRSLRKNYFLTCYNRNGERSTSSAFGAQKFEAQPVRPQEIRVADDNKLFKSLTLRNETERNMIC